MAGSIRVNGQMVLKPSQMIAVDSNLEVISRQKYVSRGGEKLEAALNAFGLVNLEDRNCADIGASTGGFTDCLLQHGAKAVLSVDSGHGDFHWKLRNDPRVTLLEQTNARNLSILPFKVDLVCVDVSFISLKIFFPIIKNWIEDQNGELVTLIKPQFEAGKEDADKGKGVIRDPKIHVKVLKDVLECALLNGFSINGLILSPLEGPKGNKEFLAHYVYPGNMPSNIDDLIRRVS